MTTALGFHADHPRRSLPAWIWAPLCAALGVAIFCGWASTLVIAY